MLWLEIVRHSMMIYSITSLVQLKKKSLIYLKAKKRTEPAATTVT